MAQGQTGRDVQGGMGEEWRKWLWIRKEITTKDSMKVFLGW
jgi:hypothetical protein